MLERARRLSPGDPTMFLLLPGGAIVHFLAGRTEQAIQWTEDALRLTLPAKPTLAAAPWNGCAP
jgi:hypothetical protein